MFFFYGKEDGSKNTSCSIQKSKSFSQMASKNGKKKKNPFADQGLDKFAALVSDLDQKKQKIYQEMGARDISFIRFVYSEDSQKVKPIVVKVRKQKLEKSSLNYLQHTPKTSEITSISSTAVDASYKSYEISEDGRTVPEQKVEKKVQRSRGSFKLDDLRKHPSYSVPAVILMILLFLSMYGRLFTILCTSIGWYCVSGLPGQDSSSGKKPERQSTGKSIQNGGQFPISPTSTYANAVADKFISQTPQKRSC